ALDGEYAGPVIPREVSRDVILCREWIGGAQGHVRPPGLERYGEVRRLGGDMQAGRDLLPLERPFAGESLFQLAEHRHELFGPFGAPATLVGQVDVANIIRALHGL